MVFEGPVQLKVDFQGSLKRFPLPASSRQSVDALYSTIISQFPELQGYQEDRFPVMVLHKDSDGDLITIDTTEGYLNVLETELASKSQSESSAPAVIRFSVIRKSSSGAPVFAAAPASAPPAAPAAVPSAPQMAPDVMATLMPILSQLGSTYLPLALSAVNQAGSAAGGSAALADVVRTVMSGVNNAAPAAAGGAASAGLAEILRTVMSGSGAASSAAAAATSARTAPLAREQPASAIAGESAGTTASSAERGTNTGSSAVVHHGVCCDSCGVNPIRGDRYKSATREDYDLCSSCEATSAGNHGTPYLKIKTPDEAPALLICAPRGRGSPPRCARSFGRDGRCGRGGGWRRQWMQAQQAQQREAAEAAAAAAAAAASSTPAATAPTADAPAAEEATEASTASSFADQMEQAIYASLSPSASAQEADAASTAEDSTAATEGAAVETPAGTDTTDGVEEQKEGELESSVTEDVTAAATTAASVADSVASGSDDEYDILDATPLVQSPASTATTTTTTAASEQQQRAKRWQKEIVSLAGMGFLDFEKNLTLLEQHVGTPGGAGMDKVLDALLSN